MNRKYTRNENVFEKIDCEEKAYWLGFFSADGWVSDDDRMCLKLSIKDLGHLEKYKSFMGYNGTTEHYISKLGKNIRKNGKKKFYRTVCVRIQSKKLCKDLANNGVFPRKSLFLEFSKTIPTELIFHYIRGYIDGDGCWSNDNKKYSTTNLTICGTELFLENVGEILYKTTGIKGRIYKPSKIHTLVYSGNEHIRKISNLIYNNSTLFLERKRNKLTENSILDEQNNIIPKKQLDYEGNKNPNAKLYVFVSPNGTEFRIAGGLKNFCREHNISYGGAIDVAYGRRNDVNGWNVYKKSIDIDVSV